MPTQSVCPKSVASRSAHDVQVLNSTAEIAEAKVDLGDLEDHLGDTDDDVDSLKESLADLKEQLANLTQIVNELEDAVGRPTPTRSISPSASASLLASSEVWHGVSPPTATPWTAGWVALGGAIAPAL